MIGIGFLLVLGLLVAAIAVKHAGYILMYGSIFEPLRGWISEKMEEDVFGFEKLSELFTCKVCMSTQVALWLVGVPLLLGVELPVGGILVRIASCAIVTFSVSGLAVWFWNLSEYRVQKFEEAARLCRSRISELRKELATHQRQGEND